MEKTKLEPVLKSYLWGGQRLKDWGIRSALNTVAEAWVLSFNADGLSICGNGMTLQETAARADFGKACEKFEHFPVLIKLIDAAQNLSVQVHPSDEYALKNEGQFGKTEMWYIADALPGAGIYAGFKRKVNAGELEKSLQNGSVTELLNFFKVKKGDHFFIPAGTVHAIGAGCLICEIQQNSNLTYRLYDYDRRQADGTPRELHIEKACKVAVLDKYSLQKRQDNILADCEYFTVLRHQGDGKKRIGRENSFCALVAVSGEGKIDGQLLRRGDTWFIPANRQAEICGEVTVLETFVKG